MINVSEDRFITCPYCSEEISVLVDYTGGLSQRFTTDCDVCCRPIVIEVELTLEGIQQLTAQREDE